MNTLKIYGQNKEAEDFLKEFLNNTLREIMVLINAEGGSLFIFNPKEDELILNSFYNSRNLLINGLRKRAGEGVTGTVLNIKTPILVKDINRDLRFQRNGFNHYKTDSFISIPLFSPQGLIGLINLTDKSTGEPFSEKDLEITVTISRYACEVIDAFKNYTGRKQELEKYANVGKLAAGIVHEINNPLDGVIRYTNILLEQTEEASATKDYLLEIKKGLKRIANITKSLLDFSHQVNSVSLHNRNYFNLNRLIDESLETLNHKIISAIQIKKHYNENIPRILDLGIQRVIVNMVKNALDAMPAGGTLEISTDIKDSALEINFKDAGIGIPREILEHIFEPFFTTKAIDKGTGLGLAICKEIVDKYEGEIKVRSSPGQGTDFTVLISKKYLENA